MHTLSNILKKKIYTSKSHFKLVVNDNQFNTYVKSNLDDNKTMVSWKNFSEKVIDDFNKKDIISTILKK